MPSGDQRIRNSVTFASRQAVRICEAMRAFSFAKFADFGSTARLFTAIALPTPRVLSASTSAGLTLDLRPRLTKEISVELTTSNSGLFDVAIVLPFFGI